jgi:hypothetical protein
MFNEILWARVTISAQPLKQSLIEMSINESMGASDG